MRPLQRPRRRPVDHPATCNRVKWIGPWMADTVPGFGMPAQRFNGSSIGEEVYMGIVFADDWNNIRGLQAKHGYHYGDDYNTLGDCSWQQIYAMLITWAKREIANDHANELHRLATAVLDDKSNVTVELGFHQLQTFGAQKYFHLTVRHPEDGAFHMFSRADIYMGQVAHIEKTIEGGTKVRDSYEKRIYLYPQQAYTPLV
ncbi:hypothetical protein [Variovorax sp. E3]|uniref:hypothetical protein n=1 Tax=Variovorax sp. E3 TaxID=1914993 RepID=UPI0018DE9ADA|nr:hypothetical protein [Variovorax sp. E3]